MSSKVLVGAKPGQKLYLTNDQEEKSVKFLLNNAPSSYDDCRKYLIAMVKSILETRGFNKPFTFWKAKHPQLSLQQASFLSYLHAVVSDRDVTNRYLIGEHLTR